MEILGIHHVTAISKDPQININFYTGVLGLRLVKISVNQDDPYVYHLFYADEIGTPGTDITFFIYPDIHKGIKGTGQAVSISFNIPRKSLTYWIRRLQRFKVKFEGPIDSKDGKMLKIEDPDGLTIKMIERDDIDDIAKPWSKGPVPEKYAIRGIFGVAINVESCKHSGWFLEEVLKFRKVYEKHYQIRYRATDKSSTGIIDVLCEPSTTTGVIGYGSIHHIAWRVRDQETQLLWRNRLEKLGFYVTPVIDRKWFKSIYFREPGYVLYEIATDDPGFHIDEPIEKLGTRLVLPEWLEDKRKFIENKLPKIHIPNPDQWR